jgi:hypothetical protein
LWESSCRGSARGVARLEGGFTEGSHSVERSHFVNVYEECLRICLFVDGGCGRLTKEV